MYSSGNSKANTRALKFTTHAAGHVLKREPTLALSRNGDTNRPLLNELNINGYNQIKQLVQKTFPNVSTTMVDQYDTTYLPSIL